MSQPPTNICRYFAATGNCYYGDQCNFVHSKPTDAQGVYNNSKPKNLITCRNITLHGYCKYAGKGCEYNHDVSVETPPPQIMKRPPASSDDLPQLQQLSLSVNPEGVQPPPPEAPSPIVPSTPPPADNGAPKGPSIDAPEFVPSQPVPPASTGTFPDPRERPTGPYYPEGSVPSAQYPTDPRVRYNPTMGQLPHTKAYRRTLQTFFMAEDLRRQFQKRSAAILHSDSGDLPRVQRYHSLTPLETGGRSHDFGCVTHVYKAISSVDGLPYVLRRVEGVRLTNEHAVPLVDFWRQLHHPTIVGLVEMFVSKDFGGIPSLCFVYHFHPCAQTVAEKYLTAGELLDENTLWSYTSQLVTALRAIHSRGMACRILTPSKVLITDKRRLRINCVGVNDVVNFNTMKSLQQAQHEDIIALGQLLLALACRSPNVMQNPTKSIEFVASRYSSDLKNTIVYLLTKPNIVIDEICSLIAPKLVMEVEHLHDHSDLLEADLAKEYENGRMFRLLVKLGFINERPEYDMDPSWSETGDRYLLKLFRDYVFHQVYEDSSPVVDFAHVVECLNKLDAGVAEKIALMSRDEQSMLIVSYKDLKRCVEEAFGELSKKKQSDSHTKY